MELVKTGSPEAPRMSGSPDDPRMSSGEALAEILARVTRIEERLDAFAELGEVLVEQVQEVAASGLGSMLGGLVSNGNSEHSENSG